MLEGGIPSAAWDTEYTYQSGMVGDPYIQKKCMSTNIFALADGHPTQETNIAMLDHRVRDPVHTVNMDLYLANQYPPSGGKIAEAGYVSV